MNIKHVLQTIILFLLLLNQAILAETLTLNKAIQLGLKHHIFTIYDLQQQNLAETVLLDLTKYNPVISSQLNVNKDYLAKGNPYIPTSESNNADLSISQAFLTGTKITLGSSLNEAQLNLSTGTSSYKEASLSVRLEQSLLKNGFGKIDRNTVEVTKLEQEKNILDTVDQTEEKIYSLANSFFDVALSKKRNTIQEVSLKDALELLKVNRRNSRSGLTEKRNLFALEADYLRQKQLNNDTSNDLFKEKTYLSNSLGNVPITEIELSDEIEKTLSTLGETFVNQTAPSLSQIRKLNKKNIELKQLELQINSQSQMGLGDLKLVATSQFNGLKTGWNNTFTQLGKLEKNATSVGLSYILPDGQNHSISEKQLIRNSKISKLQIKLLEEELINQFLIDKNTLITTKENKDHASEILKWQQKKFEEDRRYFLNGRLSISDYLSSRNQLNQAKLGKEKARLDYFKQIIKILRNSNKLLQITKIYEEKGSK